MSGSLLGNAGRFAQTLAEPPAEPQRRQAGEHTDAGRRHTEPARGAVRDAGRRLRVVVADAAPARRRPDDRACLADHVADRDDTTDAAAVLEARVVRVVAVVAH